MFPTLFSVGPLTLHTYGVMIVIAFLASLKMLQWSGPRRGIPAESVGDWATAMLLSGLVGARIFYVGINWDFFRNNLWDVFKVWEGGLVFYGGFLVAAGVGFLYARFRGYSPALLADLSAPALAWGQAIGRLGCFLAGCCYGKPTDSFWAVRFHHAEALAPLGIGLHPTQVYESAGLCLIAAFLTWRLMRRRDAEGLLFWMYVLLYALLRFAVEMLRGDVRGAVVAGLYPSQWIAMAGILVAGTILISHAATERKNR